MGKLDRRDSVGTSLRPAGQRAGGSGEPPAAHHRPRGEEWALRVMLLVPAIIHLLPLSGVLGAEALSRLYGLDFSSPDLEILMRHRAVLFGMLGVLLLAAAWRSALRPVALLAGLASVLSFLVLAMLVGGYGDAVGRVVLADSLALPCLVAAALLQWRRPGPALDIG